MNHAGLTHAGLNSGVVLSKKYYICKGKTRVNHRQVFECIAVIMIFKQYFNNAVGILYSPNGFSLYLASSVLTVQHKSRYFIRGTIAAIQEVFYNVKSELKQGIHVVYLVSAAVKANAYFAATVAGVIQSSYHWMYRTEGFIVSFKQYAYRVLSKIKANLRSAYRLKGLIASGAKGYYIAKSFVVGSLTKHYRVISGLQSDICRYTMNVAGKISIAAFVQAVPKRFQDFYTNKRWFRGR